MKKQFILLLLSLFCSSSAFAAIEVFNFDTPQQEQQFQELSHTLRCPKCQNNSVADSNAELAKDIRHKVYNMTKAGHSKQDIIDYMVARYGNFVTYNPPFTWSTAILWLGPLCVFLFGFSWIFLRNHQRKTTADSELSTWDADKEAQVAALLDDNNEDQSK